MLCSQRPKKWAGGSICICGKYTIHIYSFILQHSFIKLAKEIGRTRQFGGNVCSFIGRVCYRATLTFSSFAFYQLFLSLPSPFVCSVPIKLLHEGEGHVITVELKNGDIYRGVLLEAEATMNCQLKEGKNKST